MRSGSVFFQLSLLLLLAVSATWADAGFRPASAHRQRAIITTGKQDGVAATTTTTSCTTDVAQTTDTATTTNAHIAALQQLRGGVAVANTLPNAIAGTVAFAVIEKLVKLGLAKADIKFPGQLGACIVLFVVLCLLDAVGASSVSMAIYEALTPGAAILAKWLPVFFVPGLALLPLSKSIPGSVDIVKIVFVCSVGLVYTLLGTVAGVAAVQAFSGQTPTPAAAMPNKKRNNNEKPAGKKSKNKKNGAPVAATTSKPPKPFSDAQWNFCLTGAILSGLASVVATKTEFEYAGPIQALFLGFGTVGAYIWGARLPPAFVSVVHPLVSSSVILLVLAQLLAMASGQDFKTVLATYKQGSLNPLKAGAADYLFYILGPSVVSFAISMYSRKKLLFSNLPMVLTAAILSSVGGLFSTAAFVRLMQIGGADGSGSSVLRLSCLARNVTTALALAVTDILGGDLSIIAAVVCVTGILGASYGKKLLNAANITDPICRGLGIGSSSQGLGVAALADEPDAFPFAAMSMVLTAVSATVLVSIPAAKDALIQLATGVAVAVAGGAAATASAKPTPVTPTP